MTSDPLIGTVIAGRFILERLIGRGAMGSVYVAQHQTLGRPFAVKLLHESIQSDAVLAERFRREARAISRLHHPGIVSIADFGRTEGNQLYLVMEYVDGPSLQDALEEVAPRGLPLQRTCAITAQLGRAAQAAHDAGVVHRDLKPENILLATDHAGGDVVKILDFGLAKIMDGADLTNLSTQGEIFGTADYMAPEQSRGAAIDHRVDIYALGIIAYELCTGRPPFSAPSIPQLLVAHQRQLPEPPSKHLAPGAEPLPPIVERTILQCLEKDPEQRPRRAADVAEIFDRQLRRHARHTRVVPRLQVDAAANGSSDWSEGAQGTDTDAPTHPDLLAAVQPAPSDPEEDAARREWTWSQAVKTCRELTERLRDHRLGTVELTRILGDLRDVEERACSIETEIALAESRLTDLDAMLRDAAARLRYAVVDLSMERGRLLDEGAHANVYADLDFQIRTLEQRLADLHAEHENSKAALLTAQQAREVRVGQLRQDQAQLEVRLIHGVLEARTPQAPAEIQDGYAALTDLLGSMRTL